MKKTAICLILSLGIASLLLFLENKPFYQILDLKLYDLQMNLRKPPAEDPRILFVEMDDKAIHYLGRWPWPRNIFASIINALHSLGAKQILFDVTFAQPTQPIVDKDVVPFIFEGKKEIQEYLEDQTGSWKGQGTVSQENAIGAMEQVKNGFLEFTSAAKQKLDNAMTDYDQVLSESFDNSHSFIGYSFEVLTEPKDIARDQEKLRIKKDITSRVRNDFEKSFDKLPPSLIETESLSKTELNEIFLRSKLQVLVKENIEVSLNDASARLDVNPQDIESDFDSVKKEITETKIFSSLAQDPKTSYVAITQQLEIFDIATQKFFKDAYPRAKNIFAAKTRFGKPLPEEQGFLKAIDMDPPIEQFTRVVKGGGFLNGIPHQDGVLRFVPLFIKYKNSIFPHIAIASILDLYKPQKISFDPGKHLVLHKANIDGQLEDIRIPIDKEGATFINWAGRWQDTFRHVSGADIYRLDYLKDAYANNQGDPNKSENLKKQIVEKEKTLKEKVNGSICIIGLTATGTHDFNPIPYESTYPMVGTHGTVLNSILTKQFIIQAPHSANLTILLVLAVVIGLSLPFLSSINGLFFTIVILTGTFFISLYWFNQGLWLNLASPSLLSLFSYLGITSYKFSTEEKSKREIKNAFSKYVSPEIIEEILQDPSKLRLGGDRRKLTVLFSDIRSFTTYSEKRSPEEIVSILNEYLDAMTKVIVEHKGTLDKYVGDEIMAVFGAPSYEEPEVSSQRAVTCALKLLERLKMLHEKWQKEGLEPLDIGIGINTGEMVVGNMGSELRMDYTVIGDAVNLGARVEALTRQFNTHLIITEATYKYVEDIVDVKPLETIKVKGKEIPVMIYDVLGFKS